MGRGSDTYALRRKLPWRKAISYVAGPLYNGMCPDKFLVDLDTDAGLFERPDTSLVIEIKWLAAKLVTEQVLARHIGFKIAAIVDGAKKMDRGRHVDTGR